MSVSKMMLYHILLLARYNKTVFAKIVFIPASHAIRFQYTGLSAKLEL